MVIFWSGELHGESAFGDQPASSMSKFCAGLNSDLVNVSFLDKICDEKDVDPCSSRFNKVSSHQLTSDLYRRLLFCKCLWMVVFESIFGGCIRLGRPAGHHPHASLVRCPCVIMLTLRWTMQQFGQKIEIWNSPKNLYHCLSQQTTS